MNAHLAQAALPRQERMEKQGSDFDQQICFSPCGLQLPMCGCRKMKEISLPTLEGITDMS